MQDPKPGLGMLSTLSIGIGGMVGSFVTGLTVRLPVVRPHRVSDSGNCRTTDQLFLSQADFTLPGRGRYGEFLNRAFGSGIFPVPPTSCCWLATWYCWQSTPTRSAATVRLFSESERTFWHHVLINSVMVGLVILNVFGARLVIRSENIF